ncbi:hypothetical protein D3C81_1509820 [compost metagenome]
MHVAHGDHAIGHVVGVVELRIGLGQHEHAAKLAPHRTCLRRQAEGGIGAPAYDGKAVTDHVVEALDGIGFGAHQRLDEHAAHRRVARRVAAMHQPADQRFALLAHQPQQAAQRRVAGALQPAGQQARTRVTPAFGQ